MKIRFTPIAAAVFFSIGGQAYAGGGANGSNGTSSGNSSSLIGDFKEGDVGTTGSGGDGGNIENKEVSITGESITAVGGGTNGEGGDSGSSRSGGGGVGGQGGASAIGAISIGGTGGEAQLNANGGKGGNITGTTIRNFEKTNFLGEAGGQGGAGGTSGGGGGAGGSGGAAIFGGISIGGSGGFTTYITNGSVTDGSRGGDGGSVSQSSIVLESITLDGITFDGGGGGSVKYYGGGGSGGHGAGSVFGGISQGGSGGYSGSTSSSAYGGQGGDIQGNVISISGKSYLNGAGGGQGGSVGFNGGGGSGGQGGGSVFGGISQGGAGGYDAESGNGGAGGRISANTILMDGAVLDGTGADGGGGGSSSGGGGGAAGHGGGSVFGGISIGGAGGQSRSNSSALISVGGNGGHVQNNRIELHNTDLKGPNTFARGGIGSVYGADGVDGQKGGSIFGGISIGGAAGENSMNMSSIGGGDGGNVSLNKITLSGTINITGDIYGGISQGGKSKNTTTFSKGWMADNNTITLIGEKISIAGKIVGGWSVDGDGQENKDPTFTSYYQGNTLNLDGYKGAVQGIYNIENYNWTLPAGVFNDETIIEILDTNNVELNNTKHTIAMYNDGNRLNVGDELVMISKAEGIAGPQNHRITQGHFLVYDATLDTVETKNNIQTESKLVLSIVGKKDSTPGEPAGTIQESSTKFLVSRTATMATLNQGADMVSDYLAFATNDACGNKLFGVLNGGSDRTNTGPESHIKVHDVSMAFGGVNCLELQNKSTVMLSAFVEHGRSNYDSYNSFTDRGDVHGWGDVQYTGAGVLLHMNVAGTGSKSFAPAIGTKDGLYLNAALSAGRAKTSFDSTLLDSQGVSSKFDSKSTYVTAMVGAGYAWKIDEKQWLDFYGRYNWGHLGSDSVMIGNDRLSLETMKSSRLSLGARYHYAVKKDVTPYVGLVFEREFMGHAYGSAYDMSIDRSSLKGGSGVVELGVNVKPSATSKAWTVNMGVQGSFGNRRGVSGGVGVKYVF